MTILLAQAANEPATPALLPALETFVEGMLSLWPLWLLVALVLLGRLARDLARLRRLSQSGIEEVDAMDGRTFEEFLSTLFRRLGYRVELTRYRGDYGADLVVTKNGTRVAVQAKRWTKRVGVKAVQEVVAAKGYHRCDRALVVANRDFTPQARELARANAVELWDREQLISKLLATKGTAETEAYRHHDAAAANACCARCGVAVTETVRDYCFARRGRFGGLVYCFGHQRGGSVSKR